jgi:hypothetical protein
MNQLHLSKVLVPNEHLSFVAAVLPDDVLLTSFPVPLRRVILSYAGINWGLQGPVRIGDKVSVFELKLPCTIVDVSTNRQQVRRALSSLFSRACFVFSLAHLGSARIGAAEPA